MSELPERTEEAALLLLGTMAPRGCSDTYLRLVLRRVSETVTAPALGSDRLVVAGPYEQELITRLATWLHANYMQGEWDDTDDWEGLAAAVLSGSTKQREMLTYGGALTGQLCRDDCAVLVAVRAMRDEWQRIAADRLRQLESLPTEQEVIEKVCDWLEGRTGYSGGFTSADDVRDAIAKRFGS